MANPVYCALDTVDLAKAQTLAAQLRGQVGGLKIGKEFFTAHGPAGVKAVVGDQPLFLDLKFHDIPNTVAGAIRAASALRPRYVNVHCGGGSNMMKVAAETARAAGDSRPLVLGVTVLTSLDAADLRDIGFQEDPAALVLKFAKMAQASGLDGVVCSSHEIARLREACGPDFHLVVPGIRPAGSELADQKRVMTPREALDLGANVLVIGRPITAAPDPAAAAQSIAAELRLAA
jgi:orotidine-5'-phosphate decarboxylase